MCAYCEAERGNYCKWEHEGVRYYKKVEPLIVLFPSLRSIPGIVSVASRAIVSKDGNTWLCFCRWKQVVYCALGRLACIFICTGNCKGSSAIGVLPMRIYNISWLQDIEFYCTCEDAYIWLCMKCIIKNYSFNFCVVHLNNETAICGHYELLFFFQKVDFICNTYQREICHAISYSV